MILSSSLYCDQCRPSGRFFFAAIVTAVQKDAIPHGQRITATVSDDVAFKLLTFFNRQRRDLGLERCVYAN